MIDSSAWIHHVQHGDPVVDVLMAQQAVVGHVDVAGELRMGCGESARLSSDRVLDLPQIDRPPAEQVISEVDAAGLRCRGIGWTDAAIVVACLAADPPVALYTRDRRLARTASEAGLQVIEPGTIDP